MLQQNGDTSYVRSRNFCRHYDNFLINSPVSINSITHVQSIVIICKANVCIQPFHIQTLSPVIELMLALLQIYHCRISECK